MVGGFWALVGLGMLIARSASINEGWIVLSERQARIAGAATMVLGLGMVSIGILTRTGRFEGWDIAIRRDMAIGGFFVFFVAVSVLATIMSAVQLVGGRRPARGQAR